MRSLLFFTTLLICYSSFAQNNNWLLGEWQGETNVQFTERATNMLCHLRIDSVSGNDFAGVITISTAFNTAYQQNLRIHATLTDDGFEIKNQTTINATNPPNNNWQPCDSCTDVRRSLYMRDDRICIETQTRNCSIICDGVLRFFRYLKDYNDSTQATIKKSFSGNGGMKKFMTAGNDTTLHDVHYEMMGDSTTLPKALKRPTEFIKRITTHSPIITVSVYDDMQIDGDVVTIYHNRDTIAFRQRLRAEPINYILNADSRHLYHHIVMVADNLGSIPPNTSVMVIATQEQKYELKIESTMQKNVGVEIVYEPQ